MHSTAHVCIYIFTKFLGRYPRSHNWGGDKPPPQIFPTVCNHLPTFSGLLWPMNWATMWWKSFVTDLAFSTQCMTVRDGLPELTQEMCGSEIALHWNYGNWSNRKNKSGTVFLWPAVYKFYILTTPVLRRVWRVNEWPWAAAIWAGVAPRRSLADKLIPLLASAFTSPHYTYVVLF